MAGVEGSIRERSFRAWIEHQLGLHPRGIDLGLDRVRAVARRLELRRPARTVLTVAGTNGKGSTVAFVEALARAHGLCVGCYTSPHLHRYTERLRIDGSESGEAEWLPAFAAVEAARGDTTLSFFEFGTLAALWIMERRDLDLAVLEVGLGGRLDAVNLVDADAVIISSIGLDHQYYLGETLEQIAVEKAGVMRPERPAVLAADQARETLLDRAQSIGALSLLPGRDYRLVPLDRPAGRRPAWRWSSADGFALDFVLPWLPAPVMASNAAAALAAWRALGLPLSPKRAGRALAATRVSGRLETLSKQPRIVADVAHNPQAAAALAQWLARQPRLGRVRALFSALADKDAAGIVEPLKPWVDQWLLCGLPGRDRGQSIEALRARLAEVLPLERADANATPEQALEAALAAHRDGDLLLVLGSFALVAAVRAALRSVTPPPS